MKFLKSVVVYLRSYCENCTIAGLCYIANKRLHFIERIFWLICIVLSASGAYYLIDEFQNIFEIKAISIVFENMPLNSKVNFPSLSVCNYYSPDYTDSIENYVLNNCEECGPGDYDITMERQIEVLTYPFLYSVGQFGTICSENNCLKCKGCVRKEHRIFLEELSFNCTEVFVECSAAGEIFDCCHYFRSIIVPFGKCFLFNSLQNNERGSSRWYSKMFTPGIDDIRISVKTPVHLKILSHEDIPNLITPGIFVAEKKLGQRVVLSLEIENMINDPDISAFSPLNRKCRFSNEVLPASIYKAYSFSACLSDCIRMHQMRLCNCSMQSFVPKANANYPPCDLNGMFCLEAYQMIKPDARRLLPWANSGVECKCPASCTEYSIKSIYDVLKDPISSDIIEFIIEVPMRSEHSYRRQAIRTRLDSIVTIGGILGLFLGASILSGIEILYYLLLWFYSMFSKQQQK